MSHEENIAHLRTVMEAIIKAEAGVLSTLAKKSLENNGPDEWHRFIGEIHWQITESKSAAMNKVTFGPECVKLVEEYINANPIKNV